MLLHPKCIQMYVYEDVHIKPNCWKHILMYTQMLIFIYKLKNSNAVTHRHKNCIQQLNTSVTKINTLCNLYLHYCVLVCQGKHFTLSTTALLFARLFNIHTNSRFFQPLDHIVLYILRL